MLHLLLKLTSRKRKRLGRGVGSGKGAHTVGRGTKGHTSREGGTTPLWFEGGQLPLIKRLPYWRGKSHFDSLITKPITISVGKLSRMKGQDISPETLVAAGMLRHAHLTVKFVGTGKLSSIGRVSGVQFSASAHKSIEDAGGTIV